MGIDWMPLDRLTEAEGRDPKSLTISYKAPVYDVGQRQLPGGGRRPFSGSPAQVADLAAYMEGLASSDGKHHGPAGKG